MSAHAVRVVEVAAPEVHPNADQLEIVRVGEWSAVVRKGDFKAGDLAVYVEPDYEVPIENPAFAFLANPKKPEVRYVRLKAKKLRGVISFGLLVPLPAHMSTMTPGDDVMEIMGIRRYEPPIKMMRLGASDAIKFNDWPRVNQGKFDLPNFKHYAHLFEPGEEVVITEKIDGCNARFCWWEKQMYAGSRNQWLRPESANVWNTIVQSMPEIVHFCAHHPGHVLYGEIFGPIQSLRYGRKAPEFMAFAVHDGRWWMQFDQMSTLLKAYSIPQAPVLARGPWSPEIVEIAERDSLVATEPQLMEGIVISTPGETYNTEIGRKALKLISNRFWLSEA